jgi:hypothetical protein
MCITELCLGQDSGPDISETGSISSLKVSRNSPLDDGLDFNNGLFYEFSVFGGAGISEHSNIAHGGLHFGADMRINTPPVPLGMLFEFGYAGSFESVDNGAALVSINILESLILGKSKRLLVFGTGGYTRLFGTGNAVNFGVGVGFKVSRNYAIHFEVRDYLRLSNQGEHNVAFRIGLARYGLPM